MLCTFRIIWKCVDFNVALRKHLIFNFFKDKAVMLRIECKIHDVEHWSSVQYGFYYTFIQKYTFILTEILPQSSQL